MKTVAPLHRNLEAQLRTAIDRKAKPLGSLGRIEDLALHIGLVTGELKPDLGQAGLVIFAGDHGLVAEGITAYPSDVSAIIAQMLLDGVAGGNVAAQSVDAKVFVVDAGLKNKLPSHPQLFQKSIRRGTRNSLREAAMMKEECQAAFQAGFETASEIHQRGFGIVALGEVGIGNSAAAALVAHAVTQVPLAQLVGPGAGITPLGLDHKYKIIEGAYKRAPVRSGMDALREFGGYEMAMMAGFTFGATQHRMVVLVDGFIATAVACAATSINPDIREHLIFCHLSPEPGHTLILNWLNAKPLLDLGMRLGEGTGAALAIPLTRMAEKMLRVMADLSSAPLQ